MAGLGPDAHGDLLRVGGQGQADLNNLRFDESPISIDDKAPDDYLDQLGKLAAQRQRTAADDASSLRLDLNLSLGDLFGPGEEQLRRARELIAAEEFREALTPLREALAEHPDLREAIYLTALCQARLGEEEPALVTLAALLPVRLPSDLQSRVDILRDEVNDTLTTHVLRTVILMTITVGPEPARQHAQRFVALAPEVGLYHCLLAGVLMRTGRIAEALAAVDYGLQSCRSGDEAQLLGLKDQLDSQDLELRLEQARLLYRMGNYPMARRALDLLDPRYRQQQLWITFNEYLHALGGRFMGLVRGRRPDAVQPQGRFKDVDRLHFLLVREELAATKAALNENRPAVAVAAARQAVRLAPFFPYVNFLLATAIYRNVIEEVTNGRMRSIDQALAQVAEAQNYAKVGQNDPEIEAAGGLVSSLAAMRAVLEQIAAKLRADAEDAALMNPIIADFMKLMEKMQQGITSSRQLNQMRDGFRDVRTRARAALPRLHGQDSKDACRKIIELIDGALN